MTTTDQSWVPTDVDHATKEFEDWEASKTRTVKPPIGKSVWFILPARKGASQGATPFRKGNFIHFVRDPNNPENVLAVGICESKTNNSPCVVCPVLKKLRGTGNAADEELAERMVAKEHIICNALRVDKEPMKLEILQLPMGVYKDLNRLLKDKADGIDFTNPTTGRTVIIERTGTTKNDTEYSVRLSTQATSSLQKLGKMALLNEMADLDNVFEALDQIALGKTLAGEIAPREAAAAEPARGQVAGGGQRALPAQEPEAADGGPEDLIYDALTDAMVPRSALAKQTAKAGK